MVGKDHKVPQTNINDDAERLLARALNHYAAGPSGGLSAPNLLPSCSSSVPGPDGRPYEPPRTFWKLFLNVDAKRERENTKLWLQGR